MNPCGKECTLRFLEQLEVLLTQLTKPFFAPHAETHFQAILPLVKAYLAFWALWETKSMSHFHCRLPLWCCEFVTACYLPSPQPPHTSWHRWRIQRGLGFFSTCSFIRRSQCGAPLGWGNDPDAKLLALITQWDTCPAAPVQPSATSTAKTPQTTISNCYKVLFHTDFQCSLYNTCVLAFNHVMEHNYR